MNKISGQLIINGFSFVIIALSGLIMNFIIVKYYNAEVLGVFNTVFAIYIIASQISVCGQNFTLISNLPVMKQEKLRDNFSSSLVIVLFTSSFISLILFISSKFLASAFQSPSMFESIRYICFALPFFSLNKVISAKHNGKSEIVLFGLSKIVRMFFIVISIFLISVSRSDGNKLVLCFLYSEVLTFLLFIAINGKDIEKPNFLTIRSNVIYGIKSIPIGLITEANTRVDVICLNIFMNDTQVGVYSFMLMFGEGIYQIYVSIRQVINPKISIYNSEYNYRFKDFFIRKYIYLNYLIGVLGAIIAIPTYYYISNRLFNEYASSMNTFVIFCVGVVINSYFIILGNFLIQIRKPMLESKAALYSLIGNVVLNLVFINMIGIEGAALATVCSYSIIPIVQLFYSKLYKL